MRCEKCNVEVSGGFKKCPLCQAALVGQEEAGEVYPVIETAYRRYAMFYKILQFFLISISIISVMFDLIMETPGVWSVFVVAGAACIWLSVAFALKRSGAFHKKLVELTALSCLFSLLWDYITGWHYWALDIVVPCILICDMIVAVALATVLRGDTTRPMVYMLLLNFFGALPAVPLIMGINRIKLPSYICVTTALLLFSGLLIFSGKDTKSEIKRRLHV